MHLCIRVIEVFKCIISNALRCSNASLRCSNAYLITRSVLYFSSLRALCSSKDRLWGVLSVVEIPDVFNFKDSL